MATSPRHAIATLLAAHRHQVLAAAAPDRLATWDAVILTASGATQAELYQVQLDRARDRGVLAPRTKTLVVADRDGRRIGSGAAMLGALREVAVVLGGPTAAATARVLVIHAGGDSKRLPWANVLGKPFVPLPILAEPDRAAPTLFDLLLAMTAPVVAGLGRGGVLTVTGDVLPIFAADRLHLADDAVTVVVTPMPLDVAGRHGVVRCRPADPVVVDLLQKATPAQLLAADAIVDGGAALIDTGIFAWTGTAWRDLLALATDLNDPVTAVVRDGRECSLYEELASAHVPARHGWLAGRPLGGRLTAALGRHRLVAARHDELSFIHLGSSAEYLAEVARWRRTGRSRVLAEYGLGAADGACLFAAELDADTVVGDQTVVYASRLGSEVRIGRRCTVVGCDLTDQPLTLADHRCLWQVPLRVGTGGLREPSATWLATGVDDNPKDILGHGATFLGQDMAAWMVAHGVTASDLWPAGSGDQSLWRARLYVVDEAPGELAWLRWMLNDRPGDTSATLAATWRAAPRLSLAEISEVADPAALARRLEGVTAGLVHRALRRAVHGAVDRDLGALLAQLGSRGHRARAGDWRELLPATSPAVPTSRLHWMRAELLTGARHSDGAAGERDAAFAAVAREVAAAVPSVARQAIAHLMPGTSVRVDLPVRFDLAGGWSDTPPWCLERPARVLNLAVQLDGRLPISAEVRAIDQPLWRLSLPALGLSETCTTPDAPAGPARGLADPFLLPRTTLAVCGFADDGRIVQGVEVRLLSAIPKGSGLGGSSILAAALVQALQRLAGRDDRPATVSDLVLLVEQRMTTGGGWQDQVGGLWPGVKCTTSAPQRPLRLTVDTVPLAPAVLAELEARMVLGYTGIDRLAKNVLQIVVGRYLARDAAVTGAIGRLVDLAGEARAALALGHIDELGRLVAEVWQAHQELDPHCSNPAVDGILRAVSDWTLGAKLAGAGGGGFAGFIAKDAEAARRIRATLDARGAGCRAVPWSVWMG